VIHDILHRLADRFPVHVLVWPVRVQGETSAAEVAQAIRGFNALAPDGAIPRPDLLIVARGGGSLEDLWGFNEEIVARAAAMSEIPLIAAVGHETDWTLIDHAADVRAPTPTAAAELSVPVRSDLMTNLADLDGRQRRAALRLAERRRSDLRALLRALPSGEAILGPPRQRLDAALARLRARSREAFDARSLRVAHISRRLARQSPSARMASVSERQRGLARRLARAAAALTARPREALRQAADAFAREARRERRARDDRLAAAARRLGAVRLVEGRRAAERARTLAGIEARLRRAFAEAQRGRLTRLTAAAQVLSAVSYRSVLARGFALVRDEGRAPLRRAKAIAPHQALRIEFADGEIAATADGSAGGPTARRAKGRARKDEQGSLF
jgi:exodeoxyribonuclease VII large subunit